jgi:filamentous hemagglutinin family protein
MACKILGGIFRVDMKPNRVSFLQETAVYALVSVVAWQPLLVHAEVAANALPVASQNWVEQGSATRVETAGQMDINASDRVLLNWNSFNIGRDATVNFNQPNSGSIALNRVNGGGDGAASQIMGALNANGVIYILDRNGVLFGENSKVNVASLVASALDVNPDLVANFQDSNRSIADAVNNLEAAFRVANGALDPGVSITLESGATIRTTEGGQVFLFAPEVITEKGSSIHTPGGQTIMAASRDEVYLAASSDPDLRGMLVEVKTGGSIEHAGEVVAERGNITLAALAINQAGALRATTSVDANGSIRLLARDGGSAVNNPYRAGTLSEEKQAIAGVLLADGAIEQSMLVDSTQSGRRYISASNTQQRGEQTAGVVFADGSVTEILPDRSTDSQGRVRTATDSAAQASSFVEVMAHTIDVMGGAAVTSTGGTVSMVATADPANPLAATATDTGARITLHDGSRIDVSGADTAVVDMERNSLQVELRGAELADSPVQRNDSAIRGQTAYVDLRGGDSIAFADISGYVAGIERTVDERLAAGGTVKLSSEGTVDFRAGAEVDVSGGTVDFNAGYIRESRLVSNGTYYNISEADPNRDYDALLNPGEYYNERWNLKLQYVTQDGREQHGRWVDAYTEGKSAGQFNINSRAVAYDGTVKADVVVGPYQRRNPSQVDGGLISIDTSRYNGASQRIQLVSEEKFREHLASQGPQNPSASETLVSVDRFRNSADSLSIKTRSTLTLAEDSTLVLDGGGSLNLQGRHVQIDSDIVNHAGNVKLTGKVDSDSSILGSVTVGAGRLLDTSGQWINDLADGGSRAAVRTQGGNITLDAIGSVVVGEDTWLRADGGAWRDSSGRIRGGAGGNVTINSKELGQQPGVEVDFAGRATSHSLTRGGRFSLVADGFFIGEQAPADNSGRTHLTPEWFQQGGFSAYDLQARASGVEVADGTQLKLEASRFQLAGSDFVQARSGTALNELMQVVMPADLPEHQKGAVDLRLASGEALAPADKRVDDIRVGEGASILARPGARIEMSATGGSIDIDGSVIAQGGQIDLAISPKASDAAFDTTQAIRLGANSLLDVSATSVDLPGQPGQVLRDLYDAGSVSIRANAGYILGAEGSRIRADGATRTVSQFDSARRNQRVVPVDLAAGDIALTASEGILMDTAFSATASGRGRGGSLDVRMSTEGRLPASVPPEQLTGFTDFPMTIQLGEFASLTGAGLLDAANIRQGITGAGLQNGVAYLDVARLNDGGFDNIRLAAINSQLEGNRPPSQILFNTDRVLRAGRAIELVAPAISVAGFDAGVAAPYVRIGTDFSGTQQANAGSLLTPDGTFTAQADFIDLVGSIRFRDAADVVLNSSGDIRLRGAQLQAGDRNTPTGSLTAAGDVTLQASQVYAASLTDYHINLSGQGSTLHIAPPASGESKPYPVLSAAGAIKLEAGHILQEGVLKAPLGTLNLIGRESITLAPDSITSVSGEGQTVLLGSVDGLGDWLYPLDPANPQVLDVLPEKSIILDSQNIDHQNGALVDISGGGDLLSYYFVKGPIGSRDVLAYGSTGGAGQSFAILPAQGSAWAPYDARETNNFPYQIGDTVRFEGVAGLNPNTEYAILPAHYALLPGALLVTPVASTYTPGSGRTNLQGAQVVAGQFSHASGTKPGQQWDNFVVEAGSAALDRSELRLFSANGFFAANRPMDAGRIVFDAAGAGSSRLNIEGQIQALAGAGGTGGRLDINAADIRLVDQVDPLDEDSVQLQAARLQALNVDSILLGGVRSDQGTATQLTVGATRVEVGAGASLTATELLLAATDTVAVRDGASLQADRPGRTRGGELVVSGNQGALLQISAGEVMDVKRVSSQSTGGTLILEQGARVVSSGALTLDATRNILLGADLNTLGTLSIGANRIVLGTDDPVSNGVALSQATLSGLNASELRLRSRESVDLAADMVFDLNRMILDTPLLQRIGDAPVSASIHAADSIVMRNSAGTAPAANGAALGDLTLAARSILLDGGQDATSTFAVNGFQAVLLQGSDRVQADGRFALELQGDVTLRTGNLTSVAGSDLAVRAGGDLRLAADTASAAQNDASAGFASRYVLAGEQVEVDTRITAGSGVIELDARDSLLLGANAALDVSGQVFDFAGTQVSTDGGTIRLSARNGDISTAAQTVLDLSGGAAGNQGGDLMLSALNGSVFLGATPVVGDSGGSVAVAVANAENLQTLFSQLQGFRESQRYQASSGDLLIGAADTLRARQIEIITNQGSIDLLGTLDASGADGGSIGLHAGQDVRLASSARVLARAEAGNGTGGDVTLAARDGGVYLGAGSRFELNGAGSGVGGTLRIDANRSADAMAIHDAGTQVEGARQVQLVGFRRYELGNGQLNQALVEGTPKADAAAFMAALSAQRQQEGFVYGSLLQQLGDRLQIAPGIEFYSAGDLVVDAGGIDLAGDIDPFTATSPAFGGQLELAPGGWRYQQGNEYTAGIMRLRAAGDVRLEGSLSDGIIRSDLLGGIGFLTPQDTPLPYQSWAFEVAAGADSASAKALDVNRDASGALRLAANQVLRSGTGDIRIAAAGDITLQQGASIYTAGRSPYVDWKFDSSSDVADSTAPESGSLDPFNDFSNFLASTNLGSVRIFYPIEGGNVQVSAGGDINVMGGSQPHTDWLFRSAKAETGIFTWGVAYENFRNGIGALGGGNVDVQVAGSTRNLTLAVPTTAMQIASYQPGIETSALVDIRGGGDVHLRAGGDILGGNYLVGRGDLRVESGGRIGAAQSGALANLVALGEGSVTMVARNDIEVSGVVDQHLVAVSCKQSICNPSVTELNLNPSIYFLSNTTPDSLDLTSLAGDVVLNPTGAAHAGYLHPRTTLSLDGLYGALPAQVKLLTLQGGVDVLGFVGIEAHPDSRLDIFARDSIRGSGFAQLVVSGAQDYQNYRLASAKQGRLISDTGSLQQFESFFGVSRILNGDERIRNIRNAVSIFAEDAEPVRIVSQQGDLVSVDKGSSTFAIELPRAARIEVGGDIEDVKLYLQNNHADDISLVRAGGDISSTTFRDDNGTVGVVGSKAAPTIGIQGPGTLLVEAGGDIDLGASTGILSWGDMFNQALADTGASIVAVAGMGAEPDFAAFAQRYMSGQMPVDQAASFIVATLVNLNLTPDQINAILADQAQPRAAAVPQSAHPSHLEVVLSSSDTRSLTEGQTLFLNLAPAQQLQVASAFYQQSPELRQRVLAYATLQNELTRAGYEDASQSGATGLAARGEGFTRGFDAIRTLFNPDQQWQGNIGLVSSLISSLDGGDVSLLTPGGGIDVGLPDAVPGVDRSANQLGVIAVRTGDVQMFADGDVQVNQSRIFALDGDVSIWSSNGDIDAGRGAKTARGDAAPSVFWSPSDHRFIVDFGAVVSGSGIRATSADPGGSFVNLAAPQGVIDAGDAGIGATNVILAAAVIKGADNIDVGGVSIGVPTNTGVNASVSGAGNAASGATSGAMDDMAADAAAASEAARQVAFLTVEIIGLGD